MRRILIIPLFLVFFVLESLVSCDNQLHSGAGRKDYPITPVNFTHVKLTDNFWLPRIMTDINTTIPIAFQKSEETGRIKNFEIAGGLKKGSFCTKYGFDDSDVYKIIEGASYSLMVKPDPKMEAYLDSLIHKIALAQEKDGYLYTNRTIMGDSALPMAGKHRWENIEKEATNSTIWGIYMKLLLHITRQQANEAFWMWRLKMPT